MEDTARTLPMEIRESDKHIGEEERPKKWRWTEPGCWTTRMLESLERGLKGVKWFSLIDKVYSEANIRGAFKRVRRNRGAAGVDHETVEHFEKHLEKKIGIIREELRNGTYQTSAVRRVYIPKPGKPEKRPLGIPTVTDRVVQAAVCNAIEPIFEREFKDCSYGFRPRRSSKDALRLVTKKLHQGYRYVVDADIQSFFDTIDHTILMDLVKRRVADGRVLRLLEQFLAQGVLEGGEIYIPDLGTPQGGVVSPLLANIYLHEVDVALIEQGYTVVRYADDLVILCETAEAATKALGVLRMAMQRLKLQLHPEKTVVVDMTRAGARFTFLGYDFVTTKRDGHIRRYPNKKSVRQLRQKLRVHTMRCNGCDIATTVRKLNAILHGWFEYFKHSSAGAFERLDQFVRRRLRAILAKRNHRKGGGWGRSNSRWPTAYFSALGLFNMTETRSRLLQSATR